MTGAATPLPATLLRPPRLIGRAVEHAALVQAWEAGRAVLLLGEAGLGKSRLLAEFAQGRRVLVVSGRPGDAGVPYATMTRLLRLLVQRCEITLDVPNRRELAWLLPEMAPGADLPAEGQRLALQSAVERLLAGARMAAMDAWDVHRKDVDRTEASKTGALLDGLIVDDLHFADDASVEMLQALIGALGATLRFALAQRPGEGSAATLALRDALEEGGLLTSHTMAPLTESELGELVASLQIDTLDAERLASALARHTGGNPLFALETLKQGLAGGALRAGVLPQPGSVGTLIERRLQRLSAQATALARVAAISGPDFSPPLAEYALGVRAVALVGAWDELQQAQVLRDSAFAHDLVYEAVLRSVPAAIATHLHAATAAFLGTSRSSEPARVARHWRLGGMPVEAGRAYVAAALRAEQAARLQDEAVLYDEAARAFAEANLDEERFSALVKRVRSLSAAMFDAEALHECRALLAAARTDAQRLRAHTELCGLLTERSESLAAIECGETAMALARRLDDHEGQVRTACHMATSLCRLGRAEEAVGLLADLRAWVDAQGSDELRMLWHGDWGSALGSSGRLGEAVAAYDTALQAARRLGLRDAEGRLLLNCSVSLRQSGQFDRALALSRQGQAMSAAQMDDAAELPIDRLILARDEAEAGVYGAALPALEKVLLVFERRDAAFWAQACRMVLVRLWLDLGQYARAVPLLRDEPADMPAWLRADRLLLQRELTIAMRQPLSDSTAADVLALVAADEFRGPAMQVRALRGATPANVLAQAEALQTRLVARERFGVLMSLQVHVARAALTERRHDIALAAAHSLLLRFNDGYAPDSLYRAEAWLIAHQALLAAGHHAEAERTLEQGRRWVRQMALPHVPPSFIDSFLNRNLVNAALLATAPPLA